ncbi:predicted protein [Uncinocarpus reesii 1704]|uniref:Uncharacterized protein n=1 Tax=Uncinocarpus reesii (strain UAMH 1704) TaxID=336963 RepID=C4JYM8_UNCRE|nr:uncharacterized protein UREG_07279 [Uncinocarpus reesii 1704]EEP82414.1 predicted protein [Uncinocarpus reesii 1704]
MLQSPSGRPRSTGGDNGSCPGSSILHDTPTSSPNKKQKQQRQRNAPLLKDLNNTDNTKRKRLASGSGDASSTDADLDDEESDDANDEDDAEEDEPAVLAPSYGGKGINRKAGLKLGPSYSKRGKKVKLEESGYGDNNNASEDEYSAGMISSVSSVSSASADGSVASEDSDAEYEGVDDVSDDDDLEVEKLEEELILDEYERDCVGVASGARGLGDEWSGFDDLESRPLYSAGSFFDDEQILLQSAATEVVIDVNLTNEPVETPVPRRVHFAESEDDSSDSDRTTDDELLSDFLQQDSLDPDLRRMIENDGDTPKRPRNPHDLFATNDFYELPSNIYHVESDSEVGCSSGYESDGGETTDEEDYPPPATITHPRSILRRDSSASLSPDDEERDQQSRPTRRRGPLRGTFIADPHKPVAVVAPNGKQLIVIPPYASYRHDWLESAANSLANTAANSPGATNAADDSDTDALVSPSRQVLSPMLSSAANLMITAVVGNDCGGQVTGPPEAFYPNEKYILDAFEDDDEDEDSEAALNVDDFIDFGNGSSDGEEDKAMDDVEELASPLAASSVNVDLTPTPQRIAEISQPNSAERLLNHLDRGIVTAFRRNHTRYQTLIRLPHHREFMPANSPSRLASAFRRSKLADTRTPPRKRKASNYLGGEAVRRKLLDSHRRNTTAA